MEPFFIIVVIPTFALLLFRVNGQRRYGLDRSSRDFARRLVGLLGWFVLFQAGLLGYWILADLVRDPLTSGLMLWSLLRLLLIVLLLFAARAAMAVSRHEEQLDLPIGERSRRERQNETLTLMMVLLAIVPLLMPASLLLFFLAGLIGIEFAIFALSRRARENRLLWTLSLAARHGLPLADEVESLAFSERRRHRKRLLALANDLRNGTSLSQALLTGPGLLPAEVAASLQAAEAQGKLSDVLPQLALRHTQRVGRLCWESSLNNVTVYAWGVTMVVFYLSGFIMYWIVPKYKAIFIDFGVELPTVTESFINLADVVVGYAPLLLPLLSVPFLALFGFTYVSISGDRWMPRFVKALFPRLAAPGLLRCLGAVAERRESLLSALSGLESSTTETSWITRYHAMRQRLETGDRIADAMFAEGFVNLRESHALDHAERIGHLPWAMNALADRLEQRRIERFRWCLEFLKPAVVLGLGLMVAYFCVALFVPLVKLINDLA